MYFHFPSSNVLTLSNFSINISLINIFIIHISIINEPLTNLHLESRSSAPRLDLNLLEEECESLPKTHLRLLVSMIKLVSLQNHRNKFEGSLQLAFCQRSDQSS